MITVEEAKVLYQSGVYVAGIEPQPEFSLSSKTDKLSTNNTLEIKNIERRINNKLKLSEYVSKEQISNLFFTFIILSNDNKGVEWKERKYYNRSRKYFYIDIKFPDYEKFCNATKQEALKIMTEQTLRGTEKFLSKVKGFQFEKFYGDLEKVFSEMF